MMTTSTITADLAAPSKSLPIPGQGDLSCLPDQDDNRRIHRREDENLSISSDEEDEERTHIKVLSRRMRKRRRTTTSLTAHPQGSVPFSSSLTHTPPVFENAVSLDDDDDVLVRRRKSVSVPDSDTFARQRCYDYLHTAIDAVWAQYCDSTSFAESQKYMPHSPVSETDDPVFGIGSSGGEEWEVKEKKSMLSTSPKESRRRADSISMQPQSQSLMRQKTRLVDAKYYLSHFASASDPHSSAQFWRTWDQLKYSVVELVEGDDDEADEVIDELELGRCF